MKSLGKPNSWQILRTTVHQEKVLVTKRCRAGDRPARGKLKINIAWQPGIQVKEITREDVDDQDNWAGQVHDAEGPFKKPNEESQKTENL